MLYRVGPSGQKARKYALDHYSEIPVRRAVWATIFCHRRSVALPDFRCSFRILRIIFADAGRWCLLSRHDCELLIIVIAATPNTIRLMNLTSLLSRSY